MTKSWEDVRAETCRLYAEGKSLEQIRKHLDHARKFDASTRAFRLKLKAWKAKRADTTVTDLNGNPAPLTTLPGHLPCSSRRHETSFRHDLRLELPSTTGSTINVSHLRTAEPAKYSPESAYVRLLQGSNTVEVLGQCSFADNATNVLHIAARSFRNARNLDEV